MPRWRFEQLAQGSAADRRVRTLPCWSQFVALLFAPFAGITALRALVAVLASHANHACHLGLGPIRRSPLAEANAKRPLALYEAVFLTLLDRLQPRLAGSARAAAGGRCVTRRKVNPPLEVIETRAARDDPILADRIGGLPWRLARSRRNPYAQPVRLITVVREDGKTLDLSTNDLEAAASEIAALDKARWQVERFFRWVKQNLEIKRFLGTSEHAIKLQILTALIACLLLRLAQAARPGCASLHHLARLVKVNLMHRKALTDLVHPPPAATDPTPPAPQLQLASTHAHA
jgi:Domain of unknown function (DUF4372)/Transposase DDE domain